MQIEVFGRSQVAVLHLASLSSGVRVAIVTVVFFAVFCSYFSLGIPKGMQLEFQRTNVLYIWTTPPLRLPKSWSAESGVVLKLRHSSPPILILSWCRFNESKRKSGYVVSTHTQNLCIIRIVLSSKIAVNRNVKIWNKSTMIGLFVYTGTVVDKLTRVTYREHLKWPSVTSVWYLMQEHYVKHYK